MSIVVRRRNDLYTQYIGGIGTAVREFSKLLQETMMQKLVTIEWDAQLGLGIKKLITPKITEHLADYLADGWEIVSTTSAGAGFGGASGARFVITVVLAKQGN